MQARFYLKVVLKSLGSDILVSSTSFQKSNIGWPQQPPTEIGPNIQHDTQCPLWTLTFGNPRRFVDIIGLFIFRNETHITI